MSSDGRHSPAGWRDALARRVPRGRGLLNGGLVLAALVAFALLVTRSGPAPGVEIEVGDPLPGVDDIRVHVSGAVREPGVVTVAPGERVVEALDRAGGPTDEADLDAVNLARRLADEDHVHVPRAGEADPLIDLNTADRAALESLPGIDPVRAGDIIEARRSTPFASTDEVVERGLVPASVYEGFKDLVTAGTPLAEAP